MRFWQDTSGAEAADAVTTFFPETGMNDSGPAAAAFMQAHGLQPEQIILVHDDVELPFGDVRFKEGGSAAGHNGVRSVQAAVGNEALLRLRIGVGRPSMGELHDYVLQPFSIEEEAQLPAILTAVTRILEQRLARQ